MYLFVYKIEIDIAGKRPQANKVRYIRQNTLISLRETRSHREKRSRRIRRNCIRLNAKRIDCDRAEVTLGKYYKFGASACYFWRYRGGASRSYILRGAKGAI